MTYQQVVSSAPVVLVEFYATWCPHCQRMAPVVEQVTELLGEAIPTYRFDIDQDREAASEADVNSLPTFIVYGNGEEKWRHSGEIDGNVLLAKVRSFL